VTRCHVKPAERPHKDVRAGLTSQGRRRTSVVYHSDRPKGCEFTMTNAVERWWDFKPYMVDAQMTVNKDDAYIGSAHYHLAGHGGLSLAKWEGTHSKIDPLLDELLRNYPKVEMGKAEKTAARQ
jgi:hypothetical protein